MAFLSTSIHKLDRNLLRALNERVASFGVSGAHTLVLDALADGHSTPSDLASATGLDPASISATLKTLTQTGVLERKSDLDDLRAVRILFTKKGGELFKKIKKIVSDFEQGLDIDPSIFNNISKKEIV